MWPFAVIFAIVAIYQVANAFDEMQRNRALKEKARKEAEMLETNPAAWAALKEHERKQKEQELQRQALEEIKRQDAHDRATNWASLGTWIWRNWK